MKYCSIIQCFIIPFVTEMKYLQSIILMFYYTICQQPENCENRNDLVPFLEIPFVKKWSIVVLYNVLLYKGNNKITELRTILQRESPNS